MARFAHPIVLDAALAAVATADLLVVTAALPQDYAQARSERLAEVALSGTDFVIGAGVGNARQLQVTVPGLAQATANGVAAHVALLDSGNNRLVYVTNCAPQPLLAGQTLQIIAWNIAIGAPL
jgi:hypothetical protein